MTAAYTAQQGVVNSEYKSQITELEERNSSMLSNRLSHKCYLALNNDGAKSFLRGCMREVQLRLAELSAIVKKILLED